MCMQMNCNVQEETGGMDLIDELCPIDVELATPSSTYYEALRIQISGEVVADW